MSDLIGGRPEGQSVEEFNRDFARKLLQFPELKEAIQSQHSKLMESLPNSVKRRIKALKKLQLETTNIEAAFFKEVHQLECKYQKLYEPLYEKRSAIVLGTHEPTDEEAQWPSDDEDTLANDLSNKANIEEGKEKPKELEYPEDVKGIPDFWLTILRNVGLLSEMIRPHDEPILKHLTDIKSFYKEDPMGFRLEFHFSPNEYFTDEVLVKEYKMKCDPEEDDPFSFEGPEIYNCVGCTINWNKGKNVTLKTLKKKQKHKNRGVIRTIVKTVQNDSFFNFFSPPVLPENRKEEEIDEELRNLLTSDFEIGHYMKERLLPRAVLYYTGEGLEDEEDYEEEEDEEDNDEEDEEEEDSDKESGGKDPKDPACKQQ